MPMVFALPSPTVKGAMLGKLLSVALLLALTGAATPVLAMHEEGAGDLENLRRRIEALEGKGTSPAAAGQLLVHDVSLAGLVEAEAAYLHGGGNREESDLTLSTAQLGIEARVTAHAGAHLVLLYEEGDNDSVIVDEAALNLDLKETGHLALSIGKQYLPFGHFCSHMVSDPLTLDLGETSDTALILHGGAPGRYEFKIGVFNGQADRSGDPDQVDSWVAALEVAPMDGLACGLSYLSDLAESDLGLVHDDPLLGNIYADTVPAAAGFIAVEIGPLTIAGEYLAALAPFAPAVVAVGSDLTGRRPQAWNAELALTPGGGWEVAARYEGARDFRHDLTRYGATLGKEIYPGTTLALEYLHGAAEGQGNGSEQHVTAQLAMKF